MTLTSGLLLRRCVAGAAFVLLTAGATPAAQYFGQNKVQYDRFDFRVLATPHFDIYYYPAEADAARHVAQMAERWHGRLTQLVGSTLSGRQPIVLYASHPEFEQTNVVEGVINEATGGVTEGLRRRVVLPLAASLAATDHVLGHELVHAFQYDILGPSNAESVPLWFIEGMAEYLSLGPRAPDTAMWMRDAAIQDRLPSLDDLDDPRYFPYRFGHAFWAYIGGRFGDAAVGAILRSLAGGETGTYRTLNAISAIEAGTGQRREALAEAWHGAIRSTYGIPARAKGEPRPTPGSDDLGFDTRDGGGGLNVGPSLSPDGSRIAFLSERSRLAIELYVADTETGRILHKLTSNDVDPHFESLQFLASSGTWDPEGRRLAVATVQKGNAAIAIFDTANGRIVQEIPFTLRGEIFNPSWSPDGQSLAFAAQVGGFTDLYVYEFGSGRTRQLTHDAFADVQPAWSPDGRHIAFVTDRFTTDLERLAFGEYRLALLDPVSGATTPLDTGLGGHALNPQWSRDGASVYFIGDQTGRQEIYRLALSDRRSTRLVAPPTGVSGITVLSPALSVASNGRGAYTVFQDGGYAIRFMNTMVQPIDTAPPSGDLAVLPPTPRSPGLLERVLTAPSTGLPETATPEDRAYSPKLSLVHVGQQVGGGYSGRFGSYVSGGISFLFSDLLNEHTLLTNVAVNGQLNDLGTDAAVQAAYINRAHRWNWGLFAERTPFLTGTVRAATGNQGGQPVYIEATDLYRQTANQIGAMVAYPLSRATRVEFSVSSQRLQFGREILTSTYDPFSGILLDEQRTKLPGGDSLTLVEGSAALVRDTSASGAVSPILGQRLRLELAPSGGDLRIVNLTADVRQYVMPVRPLTLAMRAVHIGRYGRSGEDPRLTPLFLGYSSLVRGYDVDSFDPGECTPQADGSCPEFDRLVGSRVAVFNGEARVPLFGLFTGHLDYGPIPAELFGFFDAGIAWTRSTRPSLAGGSRGLVSSVGAGVRFNALGFAIVELNMARPLDRARKDWQFVFNLRPGF